MGMFRRRAGGRPGRRIRGLAAAGLVLLCAGCAGGGRYASHWDGRRGYDGNGDYGYDLAQSRSEAGAYRARAARHYAAPGTPDDPWGPYVQEAATRFQIPPTWIRAVMRQESGGHQYDANGGLTTSPVGAMGLMQVMPGTYQILQARYGLGADPYDPHNNILAGSAYIREMYDRYGAPGFLAAYNAGPDRMDAYLAGGGPLPDETVNYLASVGPQLGPAYAPAANRAYAGGGMTGTEYAAARQGAVPDDPADRAFDGGGLVTASAPTGAYADQAYDGGGPVSASAPTGAYADMGDGAPPPAREVAVAQAAPGALPAPVPVGSALAMPVAAPPAAPAATYAVQTAAYSPPQSGASKSGGVQPGGFQPASFQPAASQAALARAALVPVVAPVAGGRSGYADWGIQVGAFPNPATSQAALARARARAGGAVVGAQAAIVPVQRSGTLYRARLVGLSADRAATACAVLSGQGLDCFTVPPGS